MKGTIQRNRDRDTFETAAERNALGAATRYARTHDLATPAEATYLEALAGARRDICHRFVCGILRGDPDGLPASQPIVLEPPPTAIPSEPEPLSALESEQLQSIVDPVSEGCRRLALVPFPASRNVLIAEIAARHGYDRFRLVGPVRRWSADDPSATLVERDVHPVDLVPVLECEEAFSDGEQAERIRAEVAESVVNLALARLAAAAQDPDTDGADESNESPLELVVNGVPAADSAAAFERIVTDGHPFHPSGKIRRGMGPAEGLAYASEFTDRIDLRFVAIDRAYALETSSMDGDRMTDRLYRTFEGLENALERALPESCDPAEYAVVPVHPLQYHRTIPARFADQRADGRVIPIPEYARPATPQLNLRTVVPFDTEGTADGPLPRCKLAIGVQTTNVVRTLSPHAVTNGPQVTDVVRAIERRESLETLGVVAEPAATCYDRPGGLHQGGDAFDDARHLSGLLRTSPSAHPLVTDDTVPVVAASLVADSPATGQPLVCDLIERYGAKTDAASPTDAALAFVDRYAGVVVPEQLLLLCRYGLALESHLQNSLVVFERATGRPTATLVRDLGGIRVHRGRLADHGLSLDPYPDSDLDADSEADCYRKLYYALFQNHLAELVATIGHELAVDERACWARIRGHCERAFDRLRAEGADPIDRVRRDERALFAEPATHKALTAMRLQGKRHEYVTSDVSNPLSSDGRQRIDSPEGE
ncbi:IucA/IucC family protein [Natrinema halophilum]|uniref:IucA/IucC family siderophore biosynthesis protein n=1 Tax=Natrinema halophilum TaxID=1699371 RepID=A0A7D5GUH0_9EURY|nr:IucA/IucC family protein [Natrinema halophilum]QLG50709.1 IucA/IucC family siderophore biosynthesis protein [Natrinema halophilum]